MTDDEARKIAQDAVDRHIGDVAEEAEDLREEAYTIAFDALYDAGVDNDTAWRIAVEIASPFPEGPNDV
jgi:hypothetical protein